MIYSKNEENWECLTQTIDQKMNQCCFVNGLWLEKTKMIKRNINLLKSFICRWYNIYM